MKYLLINQVIELVAQYESENSQPQNQNIEHFKHWVAKAYLAGEAKATDIDWEGKSTGRSIESVIATSLVHLNRYAKIYSKSAILNSEFTTQDDFIYLIVLQAYGAMGKMELIRKNIHDKPVGMQIIKRLVDRKWVHQTDSKVDKRSKVIEISELGKKALAKQMNAIRSATQIVSGNLNPAEKHQLIELLEKLTQFHEAIFEANIDSEHLLEQVREKYLTEQ